MKTEFRQIYIAVDGQVFSSADECKQYEADLLKRKEALSRLAVYKVIHGFDETEGRGYYASTLIVTDASKPVLLQWCLDHFGHPLASWYGDGFYEAWQLTRVDKSVDWARSQQGNIPYKYHAKTVLVVVSKTDWTWAGLPTSEYPWPRNTKK